MINLYISVNLKDAHLRAFCIFLSWGFELKGFIFLMASLILLLLSPIGDPTDTDYTAVGCAITTISSNLTEMSKGVKLLAALMEDEVGGGNDLMRAARTLAGAVSDLLKAVEPASGEVSKETSNSEIIILIHESNMANSPFS